MALDWFACTVAALEAQFERGEATDIAFSSRTLIDAVTAILSAPDSASRRECDCRELSGSDDQPRKAS
jgi:hypothetical protein